MSELTCNSDVHRCGKCGQVVAARINGCATFASALISAGVFAALILVTVILVREVVAIDRKIGIEPPSFLLKIDSATRRVQ